MIKLYDINKEYMNINKNNSSLLHSIHHKLMSLVISVFMLSILIYACIAGTAYADIYSRQCKRYGGDKICIEPELPKVESGWKYVLEHSSQWGGSYPFFHRFNSEQEAMTALSQNSDSNYSKSSSWFSDTYTGGDSQSIKVGTLWDYNSGSFDAHNYAQYRYGLSTFQAIWLKQDGGLSKLRIVKRRDVGEFRCPKNYEKVTLSHDIDSELPFFCYLPPQPERTQCPVKNNNPISKHCGNPIDFTTGNKVASTTDWQAPHSPLKVKRHYNSQSIDIGMPDPDLSTDTAVSIATSPNGWHFEGMGQRLVLIHNHLGTQRFVYDYNIDSDANGEIDAQPLNSTLNSQLNRAYLYIQRPGQSPQRFHFHDQNSSYIHFTHDKNGTELEVYAYSSGYFIYHDNHRNITEVYSPTGQLLHIDYGNGQTLSYRYNNNNNALYGAGDYIPIEITDHFGNSLIISHDGQHINSIQLPNGNSIHYNYAGNANSNGASDVLTSVDRPGYGRKTYLYEDSNNGQLLTGIIDEKGKRYATYAYDEQGRAISTEHAHGTQRYQVSYLTDRKVEVIDSYGMHTEYWLKDSKGFLVPERMRKNHGYGSSIHSLGFDERGNLLKYLEDLFFHKHSWDNTNIGYKYTYEPDRNLTTSEVKALGTRESTITLTEWHPTLAVKTKITEGTANTKGTLNQALRETSFTHDSHGNVLTRTITDVQTGQSRTWTYTYNAHSQRTSTTTPAGLTSTWVYDNANGNLLSTTSEQGLTTTYSNHNADGKPQTITSPTGQVTSLSYDEAGRITQQSTSVDSSSLPQQTNTSTLSSIINLFTGGSNQTSNTNGNSATATTSYEYDAVGQLTKITLPDGEVLMYEYDDAHRLSAIKDNLGNFIMYKLNAAGDITETNAYDSQWHLTNTSKQAFDNLGRLTQQLGNHGQSTNHHYDSRNNLLQTTDALNRRQTSTYDALKRKTSDTDANGRVSRYKYDGLGNLIKVTDPKGNATTYTYNAFGELLETNSPDSGVTTYSYYKTRLYKITDADGRITEHFYDDHGNLIVKNYSNRQKSTWYSLDPYGRIVRNYNGEDNIKTYYSYDSGNRIISKTQEYAKDRSLTTQYRYTLGGKLAQIILPSGKTIHYQYNQGILTGIDVDGTDIINNIHYNPNGIASYTWAQTGQTASYQYDLDGRLSNINDPALNRTYGYDLGNRITSISDANTSLSATYRHDNLDRLTEQALNIDNQTHELSYSYDNNSNRTSKTDNNISTDTAIDSDSNRLSQLSYDNSGRLLTDSTGNQSYVYYDRGQIKYIHTDVDTPSKRRHQFNRYDGWGQRVSKTLWHIGEGYIKVTVFNYDEQGQLLGEYDTDGNAIREYVYLGNMPIAMMSNEREGEILQIHTDHLGTPRAVSDKEQNIVWRMEGDQFGDVQPQVETITLPLRHAGQYHDAETGLFYNYFRYYDPKSGRYLRSDPIGLAGGLNTYGYVDSDVLSDIDPYGLTRTLPRRGRRGYGYGRQPLRWRSPRDNQQWIQQRQWIQRQDRIRKARYSCSCDSSLPETWREPTTSLSWLSPSLLYGRQGRTEFTGSIIKKLRRSMQQNGYNANEPIDVAIINGRHIIIDGHHRSRAAGAACIPEVPIRLHHNLSPSTQILYQQQAAEAAHSLRLTHRW